MKSVFLSIIEPRIGSAEVCMTEQIRSRELTKREY